MAKRSTAKMAMMRKGTELLLLSILLFLGLTVAGQETFEVVQLHEPPTTPGAAHWLPDPPQPSAYAVSVAETDLTLVSTSTGLAESWLRTHVLPRLPFTNVTAVLVGKGVLCHTGRERHWGLVTTSALNLHYSILKWGVGSRVQVAVPFSSACFGRLGGDPSPSFRRAVFEETLKPLLGFLRASHSLYSIDHTSIYLEPDELDATVALHRRALGKVGFSELSIIGLKEAGEEPFLRSRRLSMSSSVSSSPYHAKPKHLPAPSPSFPLPKSPLPPPSSQFSPAPGAPFSFVPVSSPSEVPANPPSIPIPNPFGVPAPPPCVMAPAFAPVPGSAAEGRRKAYGLWCVAKPTVPTEMLQEAMDYACGVGGADCDEIKPNGSCFYPDNVVAHASYAFNSYWQKTKMSGGSCGFGGTAILIASDPSFQQCRFELS